MSKIIVELPRKKDLNLFLQMDIQAILLNIEGLSVNGSMYVTNDYLIKNIPLIKASNKEVFVSLNKIMHNRDLEKLKRTLILLKELDASYIMFYDLSVIKIAKELGIVDKLVVSQNHLNNSYFSHQFYLNNGITKSVLSNELTKEEMLRIKEEKKMTLIVNGYGYLPIFYSKRFLLKSYFKNFKKLKKDNCYYLYDKDLNLYHVIKEEKEGTTVYFGDSLDLDAEFKEYINQEFPYIILRSSFIYPPNFLNIVNKYIDIKNNKEVTFAKGYKGFIDRKAYFKVRNHE